MPAYFHALLVATTLIALIPSASGSYAQEYTPKDAKGTKLSTDWQDGSGVVTRGPDGKVVFLYGEVQPSIVCSPLQICDIELEAGEIVNDVLVGDTVRWKVEPATSGEGGVQAVHIIVKPAEAGLATSMVVTTSRRTYHIELKSHESRYMARVGFDYPENVDAKFAELNARVAEEALPGAGVPAEQLDFNFRLTGKAGWKPTLIYTDGLKTYIQFPAAISGQDAPVLFVTSGGENRIVNYRFKGTLMVVDFFIDQAILVSGVGKGQQQITIRRGH